MNFFLLLRTIRYLTVTQLWYQSWYRVRSVLRRKFRCSYSLSIEKEGKPLHWVEWVEKADCGGKDNVFVFLNLSGCFNGSWDDESNGKLWTYNLNYMDYLLQPRMTKEEGLQWINRFIELLPTNKNGLEPYPIALRGINWIKFVSKYRIECQEIDHSLYAQYKILEDNLEYHLLGNHLLEDAFSWFIASFYFADEPMYRKATRLLLRELHEQTLNDGGHYEQSPMYHCILLDRLLDCVNVVKNNDRFKGQETLKQELQRVAVLWLEWLEAIVYTDGSISLFNDSAYGIAPTANRLFAYARRLNLTWEKGKLNESGYRKLFSHTIESVIDIGDITAGYQPGHTHADTFSYELRIDGKPFVIDSGISTYNKNNRRQAERETSAHNTVTVNNQSSSEVWGGFRVGSRAKVKILSEEKDQITAQHDGFKDVIHQRTFSLKESTFAVVDTLVGKRVDRKHGVSRVILHPEVTILEQRKGAIHTSHGTIVCSGAETVECNRVQVAFEYYRLIETTAICFSFQNTMSYSITLS